jgi:hypothetical protein
MAREPSQQHAIYFVNFQLLQPDYSLGA